MNFIKRKNLQQLFLKRFSEATTFKINLSDDLNTAKKQVLWRIRNFGQLELEVLIGRWAQENINNMSINELSLFTHEILEKEVIELDGYFLKNKEIPVESKYPKIIREYLSNYKAKI